jgi:enoyl-CoA hydratase/carnithine racemase
MTATSEFIQASTDGPVTTLTLARAGEGNRLTNAMALALVTALDAAADSRIIVLRADGSDFCLGRDMQPPPPGSAVTALDVMRDDAAPILALYDAFRRRPQPVLCVVQGRAWGIGMVLAAVADLTIAASDSTFRLRELERGIPPCIAMAPLIDRMPVKALAHLVLAADEMDATTALATGVVSRMLPAANAASLQAEADTLVQRLLSFPDPAVRAVKHYLATAPRNNEANAAHHGASLLANVLASR